jgi:hypothetical protein
MFSFFRNADPFRFEKQRDLWLKMRTKGRRKFILYNGVLGWGGFMFLAMNLIEIGFHHQAIDWFLPFSALIWLVGGYSWGKYMWDHFEGKYGPTSAHR